MSHVLIVEDKEENLYYLTALLTGSGHTVDVARHGAEALVIARKSPPAIVVSDLLMPMMDGYTLLRHWKADMRLKHIPFIVYTATYTEAENEELALNLGADAFILKPAEPDMFLARLQEVLTKATGPGQPKHQSGDEEDLLQVYNETLIRKLEEKTLQLEEINQTQQQDIEARKLAERELARSNRALRMLTRCNEIFIHAVNEEQLLSEVCGAIVDNGGYRMAWVGYASNDEARTITPMAHAGEENGYLNSIRITWTAEDPHGHGPAGRCIREGHPVICTNTNKDEAFAPWRETARANGFLSAICLPLRSKLRVFGILGLYSSEVYQANADELKLLQELSDDLAFGIQNIRTQKERHRMQSALMKMAASVSASANGQFFIQLVTNMTEALDAQAGFICQTLAEDPLTSRTVAAIVDGEIMDNYNFAIEGTPCENLIKQAEWNLSAGFHQDYPNAAKLAHCGAEAYVGRRLENSSGERIGHLFILFKEPIEATDFAFSALQIFATRAAAELERLEADARIHEQASLINKARDAILACDLEHRITFWNDGCERIYGWSSNEALGCPIHQLIYKEKDQYEAAMAHLLHEGEWSGELHQFTKKGSELIVEARWTLVRDEHDQPKSVLAIDTDVTEKKKLEIQFLRAQRMESIGTLAGGIAHDLNNVLAPILMSLEILQMKTSDQESLSLLHTLESCAQRGADLVRQVLSFARGVEGQRVPIDLPLLGHDIEKIITETFPKKIDFNLHLAPDLRTIVGDTTQLHQVLMNLCVNARDAMPTGGQITLEMENAILDDVYARMNAEAKPGAYVLIKVTDTGTGISSEIQEKIFEPFFTTKPFGSGTGLGLSTTMAIIRSHGGFINLTSELGKGACFHAYFPATTDAVNAGPVVFEKTRLPRGNGETILVVDDEESIRAVAQQTLERFGYKVLLAANGAEAISIYAQNQPRIAVVLTDMAMPVMDGPATIIALQSINPTVKIIGSSGLVSNQGVIKAVGAGITHFVPKPYTAEAMLKTLQEILLDQT